jgi:2-oxoglutarate/2-oxoacid ferredoxin oxidoreductase subunit alpha
VLAPASVQEAVNLTALAFDLADKYRTIAMVAGDGIIGQMMEPAELPELRPLTTQRPDWALTGAKNRPKRVITSLYLQEEALEKVNQRLQAKIERIRAEEVRYETFMIEDADLLIVAFGTAARIAKTAIREARQKGLRVGLLRPITLFPFPMTPLAELAKSVEAILVVEMNAGQMVDDVRLAVGGLAPVDFLGHTGGIIPMPGEIVERLKHIARHITHHEPLGWDELVGLAFAS